MNRLTKLFIKKKKRYKVTKENSETPANPCRRTGIAKFIVRILKKANKPGHDKTYNKTYVTSKNSNQPIHQSSMSKLLVYSSFGCQEAVEATCDLWRSWSECRLIFAGRTNLNIGIGFVMCWIVLFFIASIAFIIYAHCYKAMQFHCLEGIKSIHFCQNCKPWRYSVMTVWLFIAESRPLSAIHLFEMT